MEKSDWRCNFTRYRDFTMLWLNCAWNAFQIWLRASLTVQGKWGQTRPWCHTCLRLLLGGKDTPEVSLKEDCSLLCIRGEMSAVHNHQSQICLLHSGEKKEASTFDLELLFIFIYPNSISKKVCVSLSLKFTVCRSNCTNLDTGDYCTD